jgi:hypothetical protein
MNLAVLARWLGILRASSQSSKSIGQQILAVSAQFTFGRFVLAATVDIHKLFQHIAIFSLLVHNAFLPLR